MNLKQRMLCACIGLALACGPSKYDQNQTAVPITPTGSLVGRVTDLATALPLEGVTVTVVGPTRLTATTDAAGLYSINEVTVNSNFSVLYEKAGYLRSIGSASLPGSAGTAPLAGGFQSLNIQMAKGDGEVRGSLYLPNGTPAVGATVLIDLRQAGYDALVTAVTDMTGAFKLAGLASSPSGQYYNVYAQYFDQNGDGSPDFGAFSNGVYVFSGAPARVFMQYNNIGQRVLTSNVLSGEIGASQDLKFTFSLPVVPVSHTGDASDKITLYSYTLGTTVGFTATWVSATELTIKVDGNLTEGGRYELDFNGLETVGGGQFYSSYIFQVRGATVVGPSAPVTNFTVSSNTSEPTKFNFDTNTFVVAFDPVPGNTTYWVYAKDDGPNPGFSRISTININQLSGHVSSTVQVPLSNYAPLANGRKVTFAVVPVDVYGNAGAISSAPSVTVQDNTAPTTYTVTAVSPVDAINDTAAATTIVLSLAYSEPMDQTVKPVLTSVGGTFAQTFVWDATGNQGLLTLTVPANKDLSGGFVIRGGKDAAGNSLSGPDFTGVLGGRQELLVNGGFEDGAGACSLTGWSQSQTGGMPVSTSVAGAGLPNSGRCAALIGAPLGSAPQVGSSKLSQDVSVPDLTMKPSWKLEFRHSERPEYFSPSGMNVAVAQKCQITTTADVLVQGVYSALSGSQSSYTGPIITTITPAATGAVTWRVVCSVDNSASMAPAVNAALYLDDLSFALVKTTSFNN